MDEDVDIGDLIDFRIYDQRLAYILKEQTVLHEFQFPVLYVLTSRCNVTEPEAQPAWRGNLLELGKDGPERNEYDGVGLYGRRRL